MGFSWGFHGVFMGCPLDSRNAMFLYIKSTFGGLPGVPRAIVPFRPYIILSTKWDGTLHGSPPATALYRGPRSKRGGRTDTPKIQRAVNFRVAYGAPRIPPPHLLLRPAGALFLARADVLRSATPLACSVRSQRPLHLHARFYAAGHGGDEPLQHGAAVAIQPQNGIPDPHPESLLALPRGGLRARQAQV